MNGFGELIKSAAIDAQADSAREYYKLSWFMPPANGDQWLRARWYQHKHAIYAAEARAALFELIDMKAAR